MRFSILISNDLEHHILGIQWSHARLAWLGNDNSGALVFFRNKIHEKGQEIKKMNSCEVHLTLNNKTRRVSCTWCDKSICTFCMISDFYREKCCRECWNSIAANVKRMQFHPGRNCVITANHAKKKIQKSSEISRLKTE